MKKKSGDEAEVVQCPFKSYMWCSTSKRVTLWELFLSFKVTPLLSKLITAFKFHNWKRIINSYHFLYHFSECFNLYLMPTAAKSLLISMCCIINLLIHLSSYSFIHIFYCIISWNHMWHVTRSRGMSHMSVIFNFDFLKINYLSIWNATFWSKPYLNWTSGCRDMGIFLKFPNNEKHKDLSPLSTYNSKSIFPTSDSFPLIMSHILSFFLHEFVCVWHMI